MSILQNLITSLPRILNLDSKILVSIRDKVRKLKKIKRSTEMVHVGGQ